MVGLLGVNCQDGASRSPLVVAGSGSADVAKLATTAELSPCDSLTASAAGHGAGPRPHRHQDIEECPLEVTSEDYANDAATTALVIKLLDVAAAQLDAGNAGAAWTCADRATDLAARSVDAHLLRGGALAVLGRYEEAALAFSMALAIAPNDVVVLRTVADAYLRARSEAVAGPTYAAVALELATRGYALAKSKRVDRHLISELATLRAAALNYLGRGTEALLAVDAALRLVPDHVDAKYERAAALFDLHRFGEAKTALLQLLVLRPDDAASHDLLGQTLEWLGDTAAANHFAQARKIAPEEYFAPQLISESDFRAEIEVVVKSLPADKQQQLKAVRFEISDLPMIEDLASVSPPFPPSILGLFRADWSADDAGPAGTSGSAAQVVSLLGPVAPSAQRLLASGPSIVLYRKNLGRSAHTRVELSEQIRDTVLHEIGHFDGLDEDDLRRRRME
ncbi:MAG: metallopeptidase family protein [Kofleriaceae bacterium]|nr:metallopeptidase family protein [Kofleriaceae bacterium]